MVSRAVQFSMSDPKGPSYLYAAREVLEEDIQPYQLNRLHWDPVEPACLPDNAVSKIAEALQNAENPLVVTCYLGRNGKAVDELVKLASRVPIRVLDTGACDLCFPSTNISKSMPLVAIKRIANNYRLTRTGIRCPSLDHQSRCNPRPGL